jgi:hypothetical protein
MLRIPHYLDNWLTDDEVVTLTRRRRKTPRKIPDCHFYYRLNNPRAIVQLEGLGKLKKIINGLH